MSLDPDNARSVGIDPDREIFTWVVGSFNQQNIAETTAGDFRQQFKDQFISVNILPGIINDITWHRVYLGQFSTEREAKTFQRRHANVLEKLSEQDPWLLPTSSKCLEQ